MTVYTSARQIELSALAFPATMRQASGSWQVEADQTLATLQAAVDAAPLDQTSVRAANATDIRTKAVAALAANDTYRAIVSPTNAQIVTQVDRLTRECSGLIRLLLSQLDTTAGT